MLRRCVVCVPSQVVVEKFKTGLVSVPRLTAQASQIAVNELNELLTADGSAGLSSNCNCIYILRAMLSADWNVQA
jgi:hypothetical protein